MISSFIHLDHALFLKINNLGNAVLDYFLAWPSFMGESLFLYPLILTLLLIWQKRGDALQQFSWILAGGLLNRLVSGFLKRAVSRPRPYPTFEELMGQGLVEVNYIFDLNKSKSFPSGHAAICFALAFLLNRLYGPKFRWTYAFAVWICISRIYVGAHFPSDVIGGAAIGLLVAWVYSSILRFERYQTLTQKIFKTTPSKSF